MEPDCAGKILPLFPDTSGVTTAARLGRGTIADVRCGVRSLARVLSGPRPPAQRTPQGFDPALIRADVDPVQLADRLAALRRFTFKITLDYLSPEQARAAFRACFDLAPPADIADLAALTPGHFSVVRRKAEILHCLGDSLVLAKMLRAACDAKPNGPRKAGFGL